MTADDIFSVASILSQTGFALAAWRLANKIDARLKVHEQKDDTFHDEVRTRLSIPAFVPAKG